ncbi:MotA/TolQ/ExbB proton channel family protein [Soonwooa sp.]|uniref:MotA/TolQ/ExbB proton channel family protein n=1 Tax=Soonwooa sp. TaxID=1938592 RepID=UPI00262DEA56|nr:MotA/TolQ/ExbB proton channel family protein [Soonwooa sp.]
MADKHISVLEFLFGNGLIVTLIIVLLLLIGLATCYFFFVRAMKLNKENKVDPYLIKNITDMLSEARVDAASDFCRRDNSPEARCIEKGLSRVGRPISEISNAMETQAQVEVHYAEKYVNYLASFSGIAPILGSIGSVIAFASIFSGMSHTSIDSQQVMSAAFYKALSPALVGLIVGFLAYIFNNYLVAKIDYMVMKIQYHTNEFLDVINKPA